MAKLPSLGDIGNAAESALKFSPDRFRGAITLGLGLAPNNRFEVQMPSIDGMLKVDGSRVEDYTTNEDRTMLCTAASIPGRIIATQPREIGIDQQTVASGHTMSDIQFSFYLTNTYSMKHYFEEWQSCITSIDPDKANHIGFYDNYALGKTVRVRQYTRNNRRVYAVKLHDAYPTTVNVIELNNQAQTAPLEVTVQMTYRTYEPEREIWAADFPEKAAKAKEKLKKLNPFS